MSRNKGHANFIQWIPLLLDALRALGGSAESREAADWIANTVDLPPEEREKRNKNGILRFENQVHWARQYLVWEGLIDSTRRGIWTLTSLGAKSHLTEEQSRALVRKLAKLRSKKLQPPAKAKDGVEQIVKEENQNIEEVAETESPELAEESELLEVLQSLSSGGFERLSKRLLHLTHACIR